MSPERSPQSRLAGACASVAPLLLALYAAFALPTAKHAPQAVGPSAGLSARAERPALSDQIAGFVENRGQLRADVLFEARFGALHLSCLERGLALRLAPAQPGASAAVLFLDFDGAQPLVVAGEGQALAPRRFWRGFGREAIEASSFARVRYREAWPGIDLVLRDRGGQLEYDLELAPGVSGEEVAIVCRGALELREAAAGALSIETAAGPLVQSVPAAWELDTAGSRRPLVARLALRGPDRFGVDIPDRDLAMAAVIDPVLEYASDLAIDQNGDSTIVGVTQSPEFPTTAGALEPTAVDVALDG